MESSQLLSPKESKILTNKLDIVEENIENKRKIFRS